MEPLLDFLRWMQCGIALINAMRRGSRLGLGRREQTMLCSEDETELWVLVKLVQPGLLQIEITHFRPVNTDP